MIRLVGWLWVAAQFVGLALLVFLARGGDYTPGPILDVAGAIAIAAGLALLVWAALHLRGGTTPSPVPNGAADLVTMGPYRYVRHPMYSAVMLAAAGISIRSGSWTIWAVFTGLVLLFQAKARWEEARLDEAFSGYRHYATETPRFVPGVRPG